MIRGLPFCTPVINDLHDLDDLQLLEMRACKEAADITKVIESATGEMNIENVRKALVTNSKTLSTAASVNETTAKYYADVVGNRSVILRPGDKFNQFTSGRPSVATKEYWKYLTDKICAGVGIPSVLVYPESMQGTVYRGALDMATAWFRARSLVLADVVREIYVYVMGSAIVTEPSLAGVPKDWAKCSIRPPRAPNVDVGRNSQAMIAELAAGTTNWDIVYGAQGLDWREEFAKLAEQQQAAEALGLKLVLGGAEFGMPEPEEDVPAKKGSAE
jgi:capsid protein